MDGDCKDLKNDLKVEVDIEPTKLVFIKEENVEYNDDTGTNLFNIPVNEDEALRNIPNKRGNRKSLDRPYGCRLCPNTYNKPYPNLYDHLRRKHLVRSDYMEYMLNVERKDKVKIDNCKFCKANPLDKCSGGHFKLLAKQKILCSICPYQCVSGITLLHHVYSQHIEIAPSIMSDTEYICRICFKPFSIEGFEHHMCTHGGVIKKYMCRYCDYTTYVKGYTPEHMKLTHNMEVSEDYAETITGNDSIKVEEAMKIDLSKRKRKNSDTEHTINNGDSSKPCVKIEIKKEYISDEDDPSKVAISNKTTQCKPTVLFEKTKDDGVPCYKCIICGKVLYEKYIMRKHILQHTDEYPLKCSLCDEKCRQKKSMVFHLRKKHNVIAGIRDIEKDGSLKRKIDEDTQSSENLIPAECQFNVKDNPSTSKSSFTIVRRGRDKFYRCVVCHKEIATQYLFYIHYLEHTEELLHSCFVCNYKAKTKKVAWNHMRRKHKLCVKLKDMPNPQGRTDTKFKHVEYNANACKLSSEERCTVVQEGTRDTRKVKCVICERTLTFKYFDDHYQLHTALRELACPMCEFKAVTTKALERHVKLSHNT